MARRQTDRQTINSKLVVCLRERIFVTLLASSKIKETTKDFSCLRTRRQTMPPDSVWWSVHFLRFALASGNIRGSHTWTLGRASLSLCLLPIVAIWIDSLWPTLGGGTHFSTSVITHKHTCTRIPLLKRWFRKFHPTFLIVRVSASVSQLPQLVWATVTTLCLAIRLIVEKFIGDTLLMLSRSYVEFIKYAPRLNRHAVSWAMFAHFSKVRECLRFFLFIPIVSESKILITEEN